MSLKIAASKSMKIALITIHDSIAKMPGDLLDMFSNICFTNEDGLNATLIFSACRKMIHVHKANFDR